LLLQPANPRGQDVRELVSRALDEAKRMPEPPPAPPNYKKLLADISEWIEQLKATRGDIVSTQQDLEERRVANDEQFQKTQEDMFDPVWHALAWYKCVPPCAAKQCPTPTGWRLSLHWLRGLVHGSDTCWSSSANTPAAQLAMMVLLARQHAVC
jgi:hypothetical protein